MVDGPLRQPYIHKSSGAYAQFEVQFPNTPKLELFLVGAELHQDIEQHDRLALHFKGKPFYKETSLKSDDPVKFIYTTNNVTEYFYGYVYDVTPLDDNDSNNTDVMCIGASYVMKNTDQKIYKTVTADQVIQKLATKYGMKVVTQRHPRVRSTVVQAGQSDWQLARSLAKQTGFALKAENTTIFFTSKNKIYTKSKQGAPYFKYVDSEVIGVATKPLKTFGTVISFSAEISDSSPDIGGKVDRVITGYNERTGSVIETTHKLKDFNFEDKGVVVPNEEYFDEL